MRRQPRRPNIGAVFIKPQKEPAYGGKLRAMGGTLAGLIAPALGVLRGERPRKVAAPTPEVALAR